MKTDAQLLRAPRVAWPTILLALGVVTGWLAVVILSIQGVLPPALGVVTATVIAYVAFTPMHDASHRSVARHRGVNDLIGRLAGLPLLAPFPAFRAMHLAHHKHTNEVGDDPDMWSGTGPGWLLPLRWLTQDLHYYARFLREPERFARREKVEIGLVMLAIAALALAAVATGHGLDVLLFVFVPARLATAALAFAFDYLPHRPHTTTSKEDRFRATHVLGGRWLTPLLLGQNYHLIHHLYPGVPFFRYGAVWWAQREELIAKGATAYRGA